MSRVPKGMYVRVLKQVRILMSRSPKGMQGRQDMHERQARVLMLMRREQTGVEKMSDRELLGRLPQVLM